MQPIHVLVTGAPGLMREMVVHAVISQADMTVLPEGVTAGEPLGTVMDLAADVVVVIVNDSEAVVVDALLDRAFPSRGVLAVASSGQRARGYDYQLRLADDVTGELSPQGVLDAIRRRAAHRSGAFDR